MAVRKTNVVKTTATDVVENESKETVVKQVAKPKTFDDNDWIDCRSVFAGKLIVAGRRTGTPYIWYSYGEIIPMQYSDLKTLKLARAKSLYLPKFIIENDELLNTKEWSDIKVMYAKMFETTDMEDILNLPISDFKTTLENAPTGLKNTIKIEVANRYKNGEFDSVQKIKAVEEICDAEILNLM